MRKRKAGILTIGLTAAAVAFTAAQRGDRSAGPGDLLVFTQLPAGDRPYTATNLFPDGARIVALDPASPDATPELLTEDFASARSPDVHFDGHRIVFAGQREAGGPWQIWELDLERRDPRLLVRSCQRCTDPVYRADDGVVFAAPAGEEEGAMAVFTVGPDGGEPERITHHPLSDGALALISDGRVLVATGSPDPAAPATAYYAIRHDGTGAELMYRPDGDGTLTGRAFEAEDRALVFVERPDGAEAPVLVTVSQAYPSTSRREIRLPGRGRVRSVAPGSDGTLLVSFREDDQATYGILAIGADGNGARPIVPAAPDRDAVEPVLATARPRPLGFVSAADPAAASATLFGLDARLTGIGEIDSTARVLRVWTAHGELGRVPLASDGSFHLQLPPDTPLRFETLDGDGRTVRGPSAWIWARPGELRGCHGCHESRALVPQNRVPMAATEAAVSLMPGDTAPDGSDEEGM